MDSRLNIIMFAESHTIGAVTVSHQPVQMARTAIAAQALEGGYDWLVMHDDDLVVAHDGPVNNPIDEWTRLFAQDPTIGVVGAVYLRTSPRAPTVNVYVPDAPDTRAILVGGMPFMPFQVESLGTGFVMVRRQVLQDLYEDWDGPLFRFPVRTNRWGAVEAIGEDNDFCERVRRHGWKVVADPRIPTCHLKESGNLPFDWMAWEQQGTVTVDAGPGVRATFPCWALDTAAGAGARWVRQEKELACVDVTAAREAEARAWAEKRAAAMQRRERAPTVPLMAPAPPAEPDASGPVLELLERVA
jgi:hypothetical protein